MAPQSPFLFALCAAAAMLGPAPLLAEPHFAYREGYKCSSCHVNQTGGGKRTAFGVLYTQTEVQPVWSRATAKSEGFSAQLGPSISMGADFMAMHKTSFKVDERGTPAGEGQTAFSQDAQNSFDISSGQLYFEAALAPEILTLYLDEIITPSGAQSREALLIWKQLPLNGYLKAGRLLLPFGIRVWDDEAFTRQVTGFNYDNQDLGMELGFEPGSASVSVAISNGTQGTRDGNQAKAVSAVGSVFLGKVVLGGSWALNDAQGIKRLALGPFASACFGPLTLMGEVDWLRDRSASEQQQLVAYGSLDYWVRPGVNLRLRGDFHDPYYRYRAPGTARAEKLAEDERSRVSIGVETLLTPFMSASAHYHLQKSIPQDLRGNADHLVLALHAFF
jgi:hypothetical protein